MLKLKLQLKQSLPKERGDGDDVQFTVKIKKITPKCEVSSALDECISLSYSMYMLQCVWRISLFEEALILYFTTPPLPY